MRVFLGLSLLLVAGCVSGKEAYVMGCAEGIAVVLQLPPENVNWARVDEYCQKQSNDMVDPRPKGRNK